jgi:hypothetical protein
MTTVCAANVKGSLFVSPRNLGVSDDAGTIEKQVMDILKEFGQKSMALGTHYWETLRILTDASAESAVDNWDGYGAKPIDRASCSKALQFSKLLPMSVPIPDISIDADGEVRYEWYRGSRQVFSVAVRSDGQLAYAGLFGANKAYGAEYFGDELPNAILDNLRRVYA